MEKTVTGAEAFTEHYLNLIGYAYMTYDLKPLQAASSPESEVLQSTTTDVTTRQKRNERFLTRDIYNPIFLNKSKWLDSDRLRITIQVTPGPIESVQDGVKSTIPVEPTSRHWAYLTWKDSGWVMYEVDDADEDAS